MFNKKLTLVGLGIGLGLSSLAAAEHEGSHSKPNFGFMYRFEIENDDDGFRKDAKADTPQTTMTLNAFRILVDGDVTDKIKYAARFRLDDTGSAEERLDYGYLKMMFTDTHSVLLGKAKARVYGWEQRGASPLVLVGSIGADKTPFLYTPMVGLEGSYNWGAITLQFAQDTTHCAENTTGTGDPYVCSGWNVGNTQTGKLAVHKQPAILFEYVGNFGGIKPLLQYGVYDLAHSNIMTVGIAYEKEQLLVELDYTQDAMAAKGADSSGKAEDQVSTSTNISLSASYGIGAYTPFLHYSAYDVDDYKPSGQKKSSVNTTDDFDDNGAVLALGTEFNRWGKGFIPYALYAMSSGKFTDTDGKEATFTKGELKVGAKGEF